MEEFLKTVAQHYKAKAEEEARIACEPVSLPLSRYLFCFPNRRSSLFFSRHLRQAFGQSCCLPSFITVNDLFAQFSTRHVIDRTALLFRLYEIYTRLNQRRETETFDQFVFWGDMLLSDFDDVDKYLVDADKVFSNVRDLKEIDERFAGFTEEQIQVISSFWKSFRADTTFPENDKHEVFGKTWAILADLYHQFRDALAADNLAYEGMMQREVVEQFMAGTGDDNASSSLFVNLPYQKVVFVGLTAVSEVDRRLMSMLRLHGLAEFCWDYADPRIHDIKSKATSAAYFTQHNLKDFPNELSDEELRRGLVADADREVSLYSISSGVGQTQQARNILNKWRKELKSDFDPLRTAIVLPDEKLLLPMLYAVPSEFSNFNVTMGYGLRSTPVAALVNMVTQLQRSYRASDQSFYFRQVLPILSHNFTLGICANEAKELTAEIVKNNLYQVPLSRFACHPYLQCLFRPVKNATDTLTYLLEILDMLMERAAQDVTVPDEDEVTDSQLEFSFDDAATAEAIPLFSDTDYEFLFHYRKTVQKLQVEVLRHTLTFTPQTLFQLLDRLVAGVSVPFSGEPLNGLQIMGVLETRALDFDNVIILSMNEGVFPAKSVQNSFIPMSLRDAFGLPTQRHRDSVFAYHFYRLLGRTRRLAMIYDSRVEGMQTGEESRYVKQMRFLLGYDQLKAQTVSDDISVTDLEPIVVEKTPEVMQQLSQYLEGKGKRNISASALKRYITCPLKFYLSFVRGLDEDDEVSEGIDAILFGNILHKVMEELYKKCEGGRQVNAEMLKRYIDNPEVEVIPAVRKAFTDEMSIKEPEGYNLLVLEMITYYVIETLRHDMSLCPFTYYKGESEIVITYPVSSELKVRFKCIIDRMDRKVIGDAPLRIVDYKTGRSESGSKLRFAVVEDLFTPDGPGSDEAMQVMLYCLLLGYASDTVLQEIGITQKPEHIVPHLYFVRDFKPYGTANTHLQSGGAHHYHDITDFEPHREEFEEQFRLLMAEIFNPEVPFRQCDEVKKCKNCPFAKICKR